MINIYIFFHNDNQRNMIIILLRASLKIILNLEKGWETLRYIANFTYISRCHLLVCRFLLRDFIFSSNLYSCTCVMCTHARVRGLPCRLEERKYGVQLGMNYDRDFSSSESLRESHRSAKLVGVSIARLFAKEAWLPRKPARHYITTIGKFVSFMTKKYTTHVSQFIKLLSRNVDFCIYKRIVFLSVNAHPVWDESTFRWL